MLCSLDGQFNETVSLKLPLDFMISFKTRIWDLWFCWPMRSLDFEWIWICGFDDQRDLLTLCEFEFVVLMTNEISWLWVNLNLWFWWPTRSLDFVWIWICGFADQWDLLTLSEFEFVVLLTNEISWPWVHLNIWGFADQ